MLSPGFFSRGGAMGGKNEKPKILGATSYPTHTKPGVGAGNGSFWGFKKARNKQLPGEGATRDFFTFFLNFVYNTVC